MLSDGAFTPCMDSSASAVSSWVFSSFISLDDAADGTIVYFLYPETAGVPLEEMDAVFGEGVK
jgi:hypothetical protein